MYRMFAAALVAATTVGGAILVPSGAAAATVSGGRPEVATARMELIQYRHDDDDRWDRRRGGYDRDDYGHPRYRRPPHYGGRYGIHPRRICSWRERRAWTPYGWRWRPVRVCRTIYW